MSYLEWTLTILIVFMASLVVAAFFETYKIVAEKVQDYEEERAELLAALGKLHGLCETLNGVPGGELQQIAQAAIMASEGKDKARKRKP